ncbi:N-acetylgalactosaminyltransferase 7-like [Acanthaster planci]|uniref:Polypeptide N-acetylgalactosaminyltransferase n=1 Tax=Acanthaster planci TaxID=133434 RepID=A0A8B7XQG1_ACAPL|nr:N-acetylgalactosaminyltransferase 7-like [Acanthaster planci]
MGHKWDEEGGWTGTFRRRIIAMKVRCMLGRCRRRTIMLAMFCGVALCVLHGKVLFSGGNEHGRQPRSEGGIFGLLGVFRSEDTASGKHQTRVHGAIHKEVTGNFEPPREPSRHGIGEQGVSVTLEDWEKAAVEKSLREYSLNLYGSNKISVDRSLPDLRDPQCKHWHYPEDLPQVSVVIPFHNEGWSTLMRTVHSVINRSPPYLLKEIVLVDDFGTKNHLAKQLEDYLRTPRLRGLVKLLRTRRREGVIGARTFGFTQASAPVIVSMDAHCEVGTNWLAPLLSVLASNRSSIVVPILDVIDNMDYRLYPQGDGRLARGMFDWRLDYKRVPGLPDRERKGRRYKTEPYRSPVFSGTVFAMYKSFFFELGGYDPGLKMYGGENYELSFKAWMCGSGSVWWVPCSRVGHVYYVNGVPPYSLPRESLSTYRDRNYARVAEVWLDDYKDYLYASRPHMRAPSFNIGDLSRQAAFRRERKCHSFGWFLKEVAYDLLSNFPPPPKLVVTGEIRALDTEFCLDTKNQVPVDEGVELTMYKCHGSGGNQFFRLTTAGDIRVNDFCLGQRGQSVMITACGSPNVIKDWQHSQEKSILWSRKQNRCLERLGLKIVLSTCRKNFDPQLWTFDDPFQLDTLQVV